MAEMNEEKVVDAVEAAEATAEAAAEAAAETADTIEETEENKEEKSFEQVAPVSSNIKQGGDNERKLVCCAYIFRL